MMLHGGEVESKRPKEKWKRKGRRLVTRSRMGREREMWEDIDAVKSQEEKASADQLLQAGRTSMLSGAIDRRGLMHSETEASCAPPSPRPPTVHAQLFVLHMTAVAFMHAHCIASDISVPGGFFMDWTAVCIRHPSPPLPPACRQIGEAKK